MNAAPHPYPVVKRIPEDQPFIVRPSLKKRGAVVGTLLGGLAVLLFCLFGLGSIGHDGASVGVLLGVWFVLVVVLGAVFGLLLWLSSSGGPVLAVGPAGLWIKTRPTRGQAIWLPWEAIALISRRRWSVEKLLVVQPRDLRAENGLGAFTAFDASISRAFYGSGFTATLNMGDKDEAEILQAVAYFAANRVRLA